MNQRKKEKKVNVHFLAPESLKLKFDLITSALGIDQSKVLRDWVEGFCSQSRFKELLKSAEKVKNAK